MALCVCLSRHLSTLHYRACGGEYQTRQDLLYPLKKNNKQTCVCQTCNALHGPSAVPVSLRFAALVLIFLR